MVVLVAPPGSEALACQRNPEAISVIGDALDIRENQLHQSRTNPHVVACVKSLSWAYRRLGREAEALGLVRRYDPDRTITDWTPAVEPLDVRNEESPGSQPDPRTSSSNANG